MYYVSLSASTIAGLILLGIGFIGLSGMPAKPIDRLTILMEPTGFGATFDTIYLATLMLNGFWMIMFFWARAAAIFATTAILTKILIVNGLLALALALLLCVVVFVFLIRVVKDG